MQCSKCGYECAAGVGYCKSCGAPLFADSPASSVPRIAVAWKCDACGIVNGGQNKFCRKCGASGPTSAAPTAGAMDVLTVAGLEHVCPACGKATTAGKPFCKHCGFRLTPAATPAPVATPAPLPAPAPADAAADTPTTALPPVKEDMAPSTPPVPPHQPTRSVVPVPRQWTRAVPTTSGSSAGRKTLLIGAITAAALIVVGVVGAVIYFSLHRQHRELTARPAPAVSSRVIAPAAPVARAASAGPGSTSAAPSGPIPAKSIPAAASPSASASTMTSPHDHAHANSPTAASTPPVSKAAAMPVLASAPTVVAPAKPSGPTHTQLIAMRLTNKAEAEYRRQNFTAAIANCKAALDLWPGYRHAIQLLQQSEQAQQAAMNSIKIH